MKEDRLYLVHVWEIVEHDLPQLKPKIEAMLREGEQPRIAN